MALIDHFGARPGTVCTAILSALSVFQFADGGSGVPGGSGCVRTIKRFAGDELTPDKVDLQLTAGVPAFLVAHLLGQFVKGGANGRRFDQMAKVSILCASGRYSSQSARLAGATPLVDPGVEDLLDWAVYYALRAMEGVAGVSNPAPLEQRWLRVEPGKYLAVAELQYRRRFDAWDDAPADTLTKLGLVHDPVTPTSLWEDSPTDTDPRSERPDGSLIEGGGPVDLEDPGS